MNVHDRNSGGVLLRTLFQDVEVADVASRYPSEKGNGKLPVRLQ